MNSEPSPDLSRLKWLGIAMIVLGVVAIMSPMVAGTAVVYVIGFTMLIAGFGQLSHAWKADSFKDRIMPLILGVITTVAALGVIAHPLMGLGFLTLMLVIFFVVEGAWKIAASFSFRPATGWVWVLAGGCISLLLGLMIWNQWPVSGTWAVGIMVGVDFLSTGASLLALNSSVKQLVQS